MKIFLTIAVAFVSVALLSMAFFDQTGVFHFVDSFMPIWNIVKSISEMLRTVLEWFANLIDFINPLTAYTGRYITC